MSDRPLPGSQDRTSIRARENEAKARAARVDIYGRRYPEEEAFYAAMGVAPPTPPGRHDRERIARERTVASTLREPENSSHEPAQGEGRESE